MPNVNEFIDITSLASLYMLYK